MGNTPPTDTVVEDDGESNGVVPANNDVIGNEDKDKITNGGGSGTWNPSPTTGNVIAPTTGNAIPPSGNGQAAPADNGMCGCFSATFCRLQMLACF